LLRVHLVDASATVPIVDRLQELGFIGEVARDGASGVRWYGREAVGELSAEEAGVIARRVVPKFAREHRLTDVEAVMISVVTAALHQCFVTTVLDVGAPRHALDDSCSQAVRDATRAQLGEELASVLGGDIEADLAGHRALGEGV
jgi:hypothetical protein